jgi:hypothetical protein
MVMKLWKWLNNPSTLFWFNIALALVNLLVFYITHALFSLLVAGFNLLAAWINLHTLHLMELSKKEDGE